MELQELEQEFVYAHDRRELARNVLFDAAEKVIGATLALENEKTAIYSAGKLTATNDTGRRMQLAELTVAQSSNLAEAEKAEREARYSFEARQAEYDLCRYRLRIAEVAAKITA